MKKLYFIFLILSLLPLSCSKDSRLNDNQGLDQQLSNANVLSSGSVIKVSPGTDDTQALINAFIQAKTLGKNATVKLMPGTFKIDMIEVKEFNGTLSGSGKGKTIITNLPGLTPDVAIQNNRLPALITFIGGNVSVSDLSFKLSEGLSWIGQYEMDLLLFSDYSADFTPAKKYIGVNLNNIELTSVQQFNYPYNFFYGAKFAPDMLNPSGNMLITRSNIDATVANSKFSKLSTGIMVRGCLKGNFIFGEGGCNIFTENIGSLFVQENIGINVKIIKNEFTIPDYSADGIDLNAFEQGIFEYTSSRVGTFEIRDNTFNIYKSWGFGLWDNWRYDHPENPDWMNMVWDHNTFNCVADGAAIGNLFGLKGAIFSNNKIIGNAQNGYLGIFGSWLGTDDPNYLMIWTENCKFLDNIFLKNGFIINLNPTTKNCLIMGDLNNVTVNNAGVNNKVIDKRIKLLPKPKTPAILQTK
ncbi:MAG: hypothetical protein WA816_01460 [Bacteroidales bacterium]